MKKVVITDHGFPSIDLQRNVLKPAGFILEEMQPICRTEDEVIERCGDADALLVQWAPITRRVMQALPRARCMVRYGVGVNNIDLDAAADLGVTVVNVPDYCLEEVSNHAVTMMMALAKRISHDHHRIAHGEWGVGPLLPVPAIIDLTLGLIGFGAIARRVARKASVFGFRRIIAADPFVREDVFQEHAVESVSQSALIEQADVISLHCPLLPSTTHLINRDSIARMRPGLIIVNTSRGPVILESDLIDALKSGRIAGAGLDVFEQEPLPADSPLRSLPNVLLTSHAASVSERAVDMLQVKAAESARDFLLGKRPAATLVPAAAR
ncbi:MAG: C-terminal binding protein [Candidatus Solibacter usitatus]|nr:C-terminal binding protein [Candidatus Solibacter usitatus]